ncbi:hypothetical protein ACETAC_05885 [Aceticella autotrophica]|uniref:Uncharacterized protein n=1 Tax=Aceticella autotrophica TaxID=2755338 RepID=A0A974Y2M1_9THEO|nr:hypothetical protein [Aceticella autotrophica]QSZ26458.1 hypothetical protein ACETAC_05885 [Aceticella autotrophica]
MSKKCKGIFFISGWIIVQIIALFIAFKVLKNNVAIAILPSIIFVILGIPFFTKK